MRFARQPFVTIAVVLIVALGVPLLADAPADAQTRLLVSPHNPVHREFIAIRGSVTTANARPVRLQYYKSGVGWRNLDERRSGDAGYFRFRTRAIAPARTFRVVAPRVTIGGRTYSGQITRARRVETVRPTASVRLVPAPVGQSKSTTVKYLTPVHTAFTPARRGRPVFLQRYAEGAWRTVAESVQDSRGRSTFNIATAAARNHYHRAVAASFRGARYVVSKGYYARTRQLRFVDDFRTASLDPAKWSYRQVGTRNPAGHRACAESSRSAVSIGRTSSGRYEYARLHVRPIPRTSLDYDVTADCPYGQYYNGHIGTQGGKFDTRYGIMAARLRFAPGQGQHGAFWSQPARGVGSEIDTVEYFGNGFPSRPDRDRNVPAGSNALQHSIYWGAGNKVGGLFDLRHLLGRDKTWSNSFHVYSVEWTPSVYIFRVDGYETFRTRRGLSSTDQFVILSLLTSDWELPKLDRSRLPSTMYADWVRVWR